MIAIVAILFVLSLAQFFAHDCSILSASTRGKTDAEVKALITGPAGSTISMASAGLCSHIPVNNLSPPLLYAPAGCSSRRNPQAHFLGFRSRAIHPQQPLPPLPLHPQPLHMFWAATSSRKRDATRAPYLRFGEGGLPGSAAGSAPSKRKHALAHHSSTHGFGRFIGAAQHGPDSQRAKAAKHDANAESIAFMFASQDKISKESNFKK